MVSIEKKIVSNYWINKLNSSSVMNDESFLLSDVSTLFLDEQQLRYFSKITRGDEFAEFTILISIFDAIVQRYFESNNIIFSYAPSKHNIPALYQSFSIKGKTLKEHIQQFKNEVKDVYKHIDYDQELLKKYKFSSYSSFGFEYNTAPEESTSSIPFYLKVKKSKEGIELSLSYNNFFVEENVVTHFINQFKTWLVQLEFCLNEKIESISILNSTEKQQLLENFNDTKSDFEEKLLIELFEEQVERTPDNIAVVYRDTELTYNELNNLSNQFAQHLNHRYGVVQNDFVGVKIERSERILISILAILKIGAAYVPVDVNYPEDRISYIENDSDCKCLIDEGEFKRFVEAKSNYSEEKYFERGSTAETAYIIYTSGTTGNPKGVMISHANAVAMINWAQNEFDSGKFDIVYAPTSYCFDLSVYEMFYPLSIGKKIRILNSSLEIGTVLKEDKNILLNLVPSSMRNILNEGCDLGNVSFVNLAGEPFPVDIAQKLLQTSAEIRNLYGPSEDTTYSTCYKLSRNKEYTTIPIGKPISNTSAFVLSEAFELNPIGVPGKLYLSGAGISKGYLNKLKLTDDKFVPNPFVEGELMYDTGDFAKWMPDGNLAFLGRKDHLIKLRGYRIELQEIECVLKSYSDLISQVVVDVRKYRSEDVLVAYFVAASNIDISELRIYIASKLPGYMIPGYYIPVQEIPLTPNGKTNKSGLPDIRENAVAKSDYVAPTNTTENILIAIWEKALGIHPIGVNDQFFDLGGHSLMISQIINAIYKKIGKTITYKVFYDNPSVKDLAGQLQRQSYKAIPVNEKLRHYPLTSAQNRMWVLSRFKGANLAYNIPFAIQLNGALRVDFFEKALNLLIERYDVFRTQFRMTNKGSVHQYVVPVDSIDFKIQKKDFSSEKEVSGFVDQYLREQSEKAFDLEYAPLLKASLIKTADDEHIFFFSIHHIIGDGWSLQVIISEVVKYYNTLVAGENVEWSALNIQYKDYAIWQQQKRENKNQIASKEYWTNQFEGEIPVLELPSFKSRPTVQTFNGKSIEYSFSNEFLKKLKDYSKSQQATMFMVLMAGVNGLLYRYTNQKDIVIGTPVAGRDHPDLENQIGLFLNTLPIRTVISGTQSFNDLLLDVKSTLLNAFEYQDYPFDELVNDLNLKRDTSRSPLFDVMVVLQNQEQLYSLGASLLLKDLEAKEYAFDNATTHFDLSLIFRESEDLQVTAMFNTDIYDALIIKNILTHLDRFISNAVSAPLTNIEAIEFLNEQERTQLSVAFNDTHTVGFSEQSIVELIEQQVVRSPDSTAVIVKDNTFSYHELNALSNQLADYLVQNYAIISEELIGVKLDRDEYLLVTLLAILKIGAAYVPIDPQYPEERVAYIQNDSKCKLTINNEFIAAFRKVKDDYSVDNLTVTIQPSNLAYIIYTSGSTGVPKGVMMKHESVLSMLHWARREYANTKFDLLYAGTSYCFDLSVYEFFFPLSIGKPLRILNSNLEIEKYLKTDQNVLINTVPSVIHALVDKGELFENASAINMAGEPIPVSLSHRLNLKNIEVRNLYGPSEDTTYSSCFKINKGFNQSIPIGKPISDTRFYILSDQLELQPIGVNGELYISGKGLSKGYLNRSELTNEKFVPNPYEHDRLMYKTGDIVRWMPDGNIEFVGRKDHQVKLRGYRIELGEIEYALQATPNVNQAVVLIREVAKEKQIVAYLIGARIDLEEIRNYLIQKLPRYMVPAHFIVLDEIPLTPNGKTDKNKLNELQIVKNRSASYVEPKTDLEKNLASIWRDILGVEKIGVTDDFFELGGHSLQATRLLAQVHEKFDVSINLEGLFMYPTIKNLANSIENGQWIQNVDHSKVVKKIMI